MKSKEIQSGFNRIIQSIWTKMNFNEATTSDDQTLINLIYVQEGSNTITWA